MVFFFFKQKTAYEIKECDWSSDVCSSDLNPEVDNSSIQEAIAAYVYVISFDGKALMPCSRARKLLKEGKALIVFHKPFTDRKSVV